jgi:hypothetical protein
MAPTQKVIEDAADKELPERVGEKIYSQAKTKFSLASTGILN